MNKHTHNLSTNYSKYFHLRVDIERWLEDMGIKNFALLDHKEDNNQDIKSVFTVNVAGSVDLKNKKITHLPVKFNIVQGDFNISQNALTSLLGSPTSVLGNFDCSYNLLEDMVGAPKLIGGSLNCEKNKLTSLWGTPHIIRGGFNCAMNFLNDLSYAPHTVGGEFNHGGQELVAVIGLNDNGAVDIKTKIK